MELLCKAAALLIGPVRQLEQHWGLDEHEIDNDSEPSHARNDSCFNMFSTVTRVLMLFLLYVSLSARRAERLSTKVSKSLVDDQNYYTAEFAKDSGSPHFLRSSVSSAPLPPAVTLHFNEQAHH